MADAESNLAFASDLYTYYRTGTLETVAPVLADDVVWCSSSQDGALPWTGRWEGVAGVMAYREAVNATIETLDYSVKEHLADEGQVALWVTIRYRFHGDSTEHETDKLDLMTMKDGKLVKFWEIFDSAPVAAAMVAAKRA